MFPSFNGLGCRATNSKIEVRLLSGIPLYNLEVLMKHKVIIRLTPDVNQITRKYVLKPSCCDCRFLDEYEPNHYYCMLFQRQTDNYYLGGAHRLIQCQRKSISQNNIEYVPYDFETNALDAQTCGQCGLQHILPLKDGYRACLGFN